MVNLKKICSIILSTLLLSCCILSMHASAQTTTKRGFINTADVRLREAATTKSQVIDMLSYVPVTITSTTTGQEVFTGNNIWYQVTYNGVSGYVYSEYVSPIMEINYDDDFEANLNNFPQSYHPYLRELHEKYPNWKFIAHNLPISFKDAVETQYCVSSVSETIKWVEFNYGGNEWRDMRGYDESTDSWATRETRWTYASRPAIEYFMDPRNSLNENNIFVFMQQSYDSESQTIDALRSVVANTFLAYGYDKNSDGIVEADAYLDDIITAASQSGVSPFVLATTIIVEQGAGGDTNMVSGTYPGYTNYYNFFNFKAYGDTTAEITASALNYAVKEGWNSREAAIVGGAKKYSDGYINIGQDTFYYKDFNVINQRWNHQYAMALYDAWTNASYLKKGCLLNPSASFVFEIPVYTDMPTTACKKPVSNGWRLIDGYWYYYSQGNAIDGWIYYNNEWYYLNPNNYNIMATDWAYINDNWYFFNNNGVMLTGWQQIEGTWYFFKENGAMHTGWIDLNGIWYYLNENGAMHTGWVYYQGAWYYLSDSGSMHTGWIKLDGTWYYMNETGAMYTGWVYYGDAWYYLNQNGAMHTGWIKLDSTWYFLNSSGAMHKGWIMLDGVWYYLNDDGAMHTGWLDLDGTRYYLNENGALRTN